MSQCFINKSKYSEKIEFPLKRLRPSTTLMCMGYQQQQTPVIYRCIPLTSVRIEILKSMFKKDAKFKLVQRHRILVVSQDSNHSLTELYN